MVDKKIKTKPNVVGKYITSPISEKKKIDTVNKTEKTQIPKIQSLPQKKHDTLTSIYNSMYAKRINLSNISIRIEKLTEIDMVKDNEYLSGLSLHWDYLASITPYILCIPRKNNRNDSRHSDH